MRREECGNPVQLHPADELIVTVNRPMLVKVVQVYDDEPVSAKLAKEWATAKDLRTELKQARGEIKRLRWELNKALDRTLA